MLESALRDVEQFVTNGGLEAAEAGSMYSALGAMFGTHHHIHVVKYTAQMWCPDDLFPPTSGAGNLQTQTFAGAASVNVNFMNNNRTKSHIQGDATEIALRKWELEVDKAYLTEQAAELIKALPVHRLRKVVQVLREEVEEEERYGSLSGGDFRTPNER